MTQREPARTPPVTVLYVGGTGRSGTTLLERIVGQASGVCAAGELTFLWERGLRGNERCGCGERFDACPFWTQVGKEAFGGWDQLDLDELEALQRQVDRHRYLLAMVAPRLAGAYRRRMRRYAAVLERVYRAIATVSGAAVVIDSSKNAPHAYLLRHVPGVDLRLVHLVRRSHGVAYSWTKKMRRPEVADTEAYMHRQPAAVTALYWTKDNLLLDLLRLLRVPSHRLRYESLVSDPRGHAGAVLRHADHRLDDPELGFIGNGHVDLAVNHTVAGNPMRFHQGRLDLRADDQWSRAMPRGQRLVVSAITWPLLLRYGYLRAGSGGPDTGRAR
jgi:Sulfotransferase family